MSKVTRSMRGVAARAARKVGLRRTVHVRVPVRVPVPIAPTSQELLATERLTLEASLMSGVASGEALPDAVVRIARTASLLRNRAQTRGFFQRLIDDPAASAYGCLGFATFLTRDELTESALVWFERAGSDLALAHAGAEYVDALFAERRSGHAEAKAAAALSPASTHSTTERLRILKILAKYRSIEVLRPRLEELARDADRLAELSEGDRTDVEWMARMLAEADDVLTDVDGAIHIAVMDYKILDRGRTSSNRGDYVQTLAAASNLVRFSDVEYVGESELAEYLTGLKEHVHPDRQLSGVAAKVVPVPLDRDFASGRSYPDNTWLICNGWFMHRAFKGPVDYPFPPTVNPIMISFHIQEPDVLSDSVVEALRAYEPIGCRDWTTVYRLRDVGIAAFFSGCVTTTVGQVLKPAAPSGQRKLADVEAQLDREAYPGWQRQSFSQIGAYVRDFSLVEGIEDSRNMLNSYATFDKVVTPRLHCYLPARSMGLSVDFRPKNRADVRFEGLLDLDRDAFDAIRTGIETKLEVVLTRILSGATPDEVYETWRRITADDVAAAEAYCQNFPAHVPSSIDVPSTVAAIAATKTTAGTDRGADAVDLAFAFDQNLTEQFLAVMQSIVDNTKRHIRCHVLGRQLPGGYLERLARLFPEVRFELYDLSDVTYGADVALLSHISVSTMDRLFLPELLPAVPRVVYLDTDLLVQCDVGLLFDLDLGGNVVAAKRTRQRLWANFVRPITRASLRLPAERAWLMRRRIHGTSMLKTRTFNAGVLVLDLGAMRDENFTAENLHLVESCWLNDQDVLNVYCRDRVLELEPAWNTVPSQDSELDPRIIHWAGPAKPWKTDYVLFRDRYLAAAAKVAARETV
jgi:lipopolysaccharide biosynthesis glycosyltransferase